MSDFVLLKFTKFVLAAFGDNVSTLNHSFNALQLMNNTLNKFLMLFDEWYKDVLLANKIAVLY